MRQDCERKVNGVLFDRDALPIRLSVTGIHMLGALKLLMKACARFDQHCRRSLAPNMEFESLLSSFISPFLDVVACFVSDDAATHRIRPNGIAALVSDTLDLGYLSIVRCCIGLSLVYLVNCQSGESRGVLSVFLVSSSLSPNQTYMYLVYYAIFLHK